MSFLSIATPFAELGIRVFPLQPGKKVPIADMKFLTEATTNMTRVEEWNTENCNYNVGILADDNFCFLEFDIKEGMKLAAEEMGEVRPETRMQRSGAARSPTMTHGAIVLPVVTRGRIEASAMRRPSMP